jgi:hypothetical protein
MRNARVGSREVHENQERAMRGSMLGKLLKDGWLLLIAMITILVASLNASVILPPELLRTLLTIFR